jgi:dCMP deaminase
MNEHEKFINICETLSVMSKCVSHKVAAIIVKEGTIISTGINGTPSKYKNCRDVFIDYNPETDRERHKLFSDKFEIHGEKAAINNAAKFGISINGCTLYSLYQPCFQCLKDIISAGIKTIVYKYSYDRIENKEEWHSFAAQFLQIKQVN